MSSKPKLSSTDSLFENSNIGNEKLLNKEELSVFLNVSIKMIDKLVMLNDIPYFKIGKSVRFDKQRVLERFSAGLKTG